MTFIPHTTIGFCSMVFVCQSAGCECTPAMLVASIIGATLPDIDCSKSFIGRYTYFISAAAESIFGHRGMFHSPLFWAVLFIPALLLTHEAEWFPVVLGLAVGYASHLIADWQTNSGIPLLWPCKKRFSAFWAFKTGSMIEVAIVGILSFWILSQGKYLLG